MRIIPVAETGIPSGILSIASELPDPRQVSAGDKLTIAFVGGESSPVEKVHAIRLIRSFDWVIEFQQALLRRFAVQVFCGKAGLPF